MARGIEVGNIFPLGTKYSKDFDLCFIDSHGKKQFVIMGCYGIGLGRLMATIVEVNHDSKGIIWPKEVAPFQIHLIPIEIEDKTVKSVADNIYENLHKENIEVLYDEREEVGPGEKLVESDLLGIPIRVVVSKKTLQKNQVEVKERRSTRINLVKKLGIIKYIKELL